MNNLSPTEIDQSRILITGGAGFIGSHLAEKLVAAGARVIILDNYDPYYNRSLKEQNVRSILSSPDCTLIEADIRDSGQLNNFLSKQPVDTIVHLAARAGVRPSLEQPELYADVNVRGTTVLLEAARNHNIRSFVFASSSSVYGNRSRLPFSEEDRTDSPFSPYGATKKAGEALAYAWHSVYGLSVACLRFFTVYGPRQRPDLAIRKFVRNVLTEKPIPIYGDGSSRRDYTHIEDIVGGILGAIRWTRESDSRYDVFNLGSSNPVLLRDLVDQIESLAGVPVRREWLSAQPGDVSATYADTNKAEQVLGYRHQINFSDGLKDFITWMKRRQAEGDIL